VSESGQTQDIPPGHTTDGNFERVLRSGTFAVTAELNPPDSANPEDVYEGAAPLIAVCDAINATSVAEIASSLIITRLRVLFIGTRVIVTAT